jgi:hypothetical protein
LPNSEIKMNIIIDYKKDLLTLLGFINTYDTFPKIKENKKIWQMYIMLKL